MFWGKIILKYCENCGAELQPGEKFCHNCGAKITSEKNESNNDQSVIKDEKKDNSENQHDSNMSGEEKQHQTTQSSFEVVDDDHPRKLNKKVIAGVVSILVIILAIFGYHSYSTNVRYAVRGKAYNVYVKTSDMKSRVSAGYIVFGKGANKGKVVETNSKSEALSLAKDDTKFAAKYAKNSDNDNDDPFDKPLEYTATKNSLKVTSYLSGSDSSVNDSVTALSLNGKVSGGTIAGIGKLTNKIYDDGDTDTFDVEILLEPANY